MAFYLLCVHLPFGLALAAPALFARPGAGISRLPLEVMAFGAPEFGTVSDAINLATGNVYLGTDALSHNKNLDPDKPEQDESTAPVVQNWNYQSRLRLNGFSRNLVVGPTPSGSGLVNLLSPQDTSGPGWNAVGVRPSTTLVHRLSSKDTLTAADGSVTNPLSGFARLENVPSGRYRVSLRAHTLKGTLPIQYGLDDTRLASATLTTSWQSVSSDFTLSSPGSALMQVLERTAKNPAWEVSDLAMYSLDETGAPNSPNLITTPHPGAAYWTPVGLKPGASLLNEFAPTDPPVEADPSSGVVKSGPLQPGFYYVQFSGFVASGTLDVKVGLNETASDTVTLTTKPQTFVREFDLNTPSSSQFRLWESTAQNPAWTVYGMVVRQRLEAPERFSLSSGDGSVSGFVAVTPGTPPAPAWSELPLWIARYQGQPRSRIYRLEAQGGLQYSPEWLVLLERPGGKTVAHHYTSGGSRSTFYRDGEYADYTQNLSQQQRALDAGFPEGDANGTARTELTYRGFNTGRMLQVNDEWGRRTDYSYTPQNQLTRIRYLRQGDGSYAREVGLTYSDDGTQLLSLNYLAPDGQTSSGNQRRTVSFKYRGSAISEIARDLPGGGKHLTGYSFDDADRVIKVTQTGESDTLYSYDTTNANAPVVTVTQGDKRSSYTFAGTLLKSRSEWDGVRTLIWNYTYDPATGSTQSVLEPSGQKTEYGYDARGNLNQTLETASGQNRQRETTFDRNNRPTSTVVSGGSTRLETLNSYTAAASGFVQAQQTTVRGGGLNHTTTTNFDAQGRLTVSSKSWSGQQLSYTYGYATGGSFAAPLSSGQRVSPPATQYGDLVSSANRQATGTNVAGLSQTFAYDALGHVVQETQNDRVYQRAFSGFGSQTWEQVGNGVGVASEQVSVYHPSGELLRSWEGTSGNFTSYSYNLSGQLSAVRRPHGSSSYSYDSLGRPRFQTEDGYTTSLSYDPLDREIGRTLPDGTSQITRYAANGAISSQTHGGDSTLIESNAWGNSTAITYPDGGRVDTQYDPFGQPTQIVDYRQSGGNHVTRMDYDPGGLLVTLDAPNGNTTQYQYDGTGQILREERTVETKAFAVRTGFEVSFNIYDSAAVTRYVRDGLGNPTFITDPRGYSTSSRYDAWGNRLSEQHSYGTLSGTYDALNRPLEQTDARGYTVKHLYDRLGNPLERTNESGNTERFTYTVDGLLTSHTDTGGVLLESRSYGNRIYPSSIRKAIGDSYRTDTYSYDYAGRPTAAGSLSMRYDSYGNLLSRSADGFTTTFSYDSMSRMLSKDENGPNDDAIDGGELKYRYSYDRAGNLTEECVGETCTQYNYNSVGKVVLERQGVRRGLLYTSTSPQFPLLPIGGTLPESSPIRETRYTYRQDGAMTSKTLPSGGRIEYSLDAGGVVLAESSVDVISYFTSNERGQMLERKVIPGPHRFGIAVYGSLPNPTQSVSTSPITPKYDEGYEHIQTKWAYDAGGNLTEYSHVRIPPPTNPLGVTTFPIGQEPYSPAGFVVGTAVHGQSYTYEYSPTGKETKQSYTLSNAYLGKRSQDFKPELGLGATRGTLNSTYDARDLLSKVDLTNERGRLRKLAGSYYDKFDFTALGMPLTRSTQYTYYPSTAIKRTTVSGDTEATEEDSDQSDTPYGRQRVDNSIEAQYSPAGELIKQQVRRETTDLDNNYTYTNAYSLSITRQPGRAAYSMTNSNGQVNWTEEYTLGNRLTLKDGASYRYDKQGLLLNIKAANMPPTTDLERNLAGDVVRDGANRFVRDAGGTLLRVEPVNEIGTTIRATNNSLGQPLSLSSTNNPVDDSVGYNGGHFTYGPDGDISSISYTEDKADENQERRSFTTSFRTYDPYGTLAQNGFAAIDDAFYGLDSYYPSYSSTYTQIALSVEGAPQFVRVYQGTLSGSGYTSTISTSDRATYDATLTAGDSALRGPNYVCYSPQPASPPGDTGGYLRFKKSKPSSAPPTLRPLETPQNSSLSGTLNLDIANLTAPTLGITPLGSLSTAPNGTGTLQPLEAPQSVLPPALQNPSFNPGALNLPSSDPVSAPLTDTSIAPPSSTSNAPQITLPSSGKGGIDALPQLQLKPLETPKKTARAKGSDPFTSLCATPVGNLNEYVKLRLDSSAGSDPLWGANLAHQAFGEVRNRLSSLPGAGIYAVQNKDALEDMLKQSWKFSPRAQLNFWEAVDYHLGLQGDSAEASRWLADFAQSARAGKLCKTAWVPADFHHKYRSTIVSREFDKTHPVLPWWQDFQVQPPDWDIAALAVLPLMAAVAAAELAALGVVFALSSPRAQMALSNLSSRIAQRSAQGSQRVQMELQQQMSQRSLTTGSSLPKAGERLSDSEIVLLGNVPKSGNFILRPGVDDKAIGGVAAPGKSVSIAQTLTFSDEMAQMFGPARGLKTGDRLSGAFVSDIRAAGFDVIYAPTSTNPFHARIVSGVRTFDESGRDWLSLAFDVLYKKNR